jgi:hypothetical protein
MKQFGKKWLKRVDENPIRQEGLDRRTFLRRGGVALGSGALMSLLPLSAVRQASAQEEINVPPPDTPTEIRR